jgi:hypothetical protein
MYFKYQNLFIHQIARLAQSVERETLSIHGLKNRLDPASQGCGFDPHVGLLFALAASFFILNRCYGIFCASPPACREMRCHFAA